MASNKGKGPTFKIIIMGQCAVGKSCLLVRFLKDKFDTEYQSTVGCQFAKSEIKISEDVVAQVQIWDTAGQETFRSIIKNLYNKTSACFLTYSIANKQSLEKLTFWLKEARENCPSECLFVLIGAQCDRQDQRQVSILQAQKFVEQNKMDYFMQTSAKQSKNVQQVFTAVTRKIYQKNQKKNQVQQTEKLQLQQSKKKKKCC